MVNLRTTMVELVVTKPTGLTYATRRLKAGESFTTTAHDARILVAGKKARYAQEMPTGRVKAPAPRVARKIETATSPQTGRVGAMTTPESRVSSGAVSPATHPVDQSGTVVAIPADWADLPWIPNAEGNSIRKLAMDISGGSVNTKADAIAVIEQEIARRNPK